MINLFKNKSTIILIDSTSKEAKHYSLAKFHIKYWPFYLIIFFIMLSLLSFATYSYYQQFSYKKYEIKSLKNSLLSKTAIEKGHYLLNLEKQNLQLQEKIEKIHIYLSKKNINSKSHQNNKTIPLGLGGPYLEDKKSGGALANKIDQQINELDLLFQKILYVPLGLPSTGALASGFGYRNNPFGYESGGLENHKGLDFQGQHGDNVYATASGTISHAGILGGYGLLITINHNNGYETYYAHLSKLNVRAGDKVNRGQVIGYIGSTGRSTGPHLHYEVRYNQEHLDPEKFLYYQQEASK